MFIYIVSAPYFINGHHNVAGLAIADEINALIANKECVSNHDACLNIVSGYPYFELFGLRLEKEYI